MSPEAAEELVKYSHIFVECGAVLVQDSLTQVDLDVLRKVRSRIPNGPLREWIKACLFAETYGTRP